MKNVITINQKDPNLIVQYSEEFEINRKTMVSVPTNYIGIVLIDSEVLKRLKPGENITIVDDLDKSYIGHNIQVAFILDKAIPQLKWGFGDVNVNNKRLKEAYRVGSHGTCVLKITNAGKFIKNFGLGVDVDIEDVREKCLSAIKAIGVQILSSYFSNTNNSIFEIEQYIGEIQQKMEKELISCEDFDDLGVEVSNVGVNRIYINEEDLEEIRKAVKERD